jgi:hypothetical protein
MMNAVNFRHRDYLVRNIVASLNGGISVNEMESNVMRLARLERSNRRLKSCVIGLTIGVGSLAILGMANSAPKVLTAEKFLLVDDQGIERAELSTNNKAAALQFLNPNQTRAIVVARGSQGSGIYMSDGKGNVRTGMLVNDDSTATIAMMNGEAESFTVKDGREGTALTFADAAGHTKIALGSTPKGASLNIWDGNDTLRVGVAEQGVLTFDKGGLLEWASFGEKLSPEERKKVMDLINSTPGIRP